MGAKCGNTITLYAAQAEPVWQAIQRDGAAYSKAEYVEKKYGESAPVFLTAYRWFIAQLPRYVPKPEGSDFPYWAYADLYMMETGAYPHILTLEVPLEEAVFFDMNDWNKVLQMNYLGENESDTRRFQRELRERGVGAADVMLSRFYPDLQQQITASWQRLFRHHEAARQGERPVADLQAGLWCIKKEWITHDNGVPVK